MAPIDRPRTSDRWAIQPTRITGTEATVAAADRCAMYSPSWGTELIRNIGRVAALVTVRLSARNSSFQAKITQISAVEISPGEMTGRITSVILPIISPGLAATALICFIFAWNEFFLAVNLTTVNAATVPIYLVGFVQPEGPFLAHLSAAATIACLPVLIAGWAAQDKLVRGLSMGAVK